MLFAYSKRHGIKPCAALYLSEKRAKFRTNSTTKPISSKGEAMKHALVFLLLASCAQPVPAVTYLPDGSAILSKDEVEITVSNFNKLLEMVNALKEKLRVLEESKMCKGV